MLIGSYFFPYMFFFIIKTLECGVKLEIIHKITLKDTCTRPRKYEKADQKNSELCCFQTNLPLAALPLWWWYLYNCASATCRRGMTKRQAASSQLIDNLAALPTAADRKTVEFYSTWERCRSVIKPKRRCRWELQLWNSKRWSRGKAAMRQAAS